MGKSKKKGKSKKPGYVLGSLLVALLAVALPAQAADWTHGVDMLTTRADAGVTCISGCSDAGGSVGIGVNNLLAVFHENLTLKGYVVSWRDERVLEAGNITVGYSRPSGDAAGQEDGFVFLGAGAYLLEAFHLEAVYGLNNDLASNYGARISVDMPTLGTKLVAMTQKAWGYTGL